MRVFQLDKKFSVLCDWKRTRIAFKHEAQVLCNGSEYGRKVKILYLNRTWECFEYESVLNKAIEDNFEGKDLKKYLSVVAKFN